MANPDTQFISRHLTFMQPEKPTTPKVLSTKYAPFLVAKRNPSSTVGMDTTVFHCTRTIANVSHIPNKTKVIDDTLLWADDLAGSFHQAVNWLDICGRHGIILNPDKFVFGQVRVRRLRDYPYECSPLCEIPRCHPPIPNTVQHHGHTILVWPH